MILLYVVSFNIAGVDFWMTLDHLLARTTFYSYLMNLNRIGNIGAKCVCVGCLIPD